MRKPEFHFPAIYKKARRGGPAIILPKDIGMVIAYTGIGKESVVVEAGGGSGFLTIALANVCKKIHSYEVKEEFAKLVGENVANAGFSNVEVKNKDVLQGIDEKDVDLVVLDMLDAEKAVQIAHSALKKGGFLVGYMPHTDQTQRFYLECQKYFSRIFTMESIIREYDVKERGMRPQHFGLQHSAYLVFAQK
ncbi:methyltransferase domain-containing protein [Candidatus Micrarchaeota archaeon]|nr:methyltransferase domain-containing protein [Candidatus Micrarchaeota archaeon]